MEGTARPKAWKWERLWQTHKVGLVTGSECRLRTQGTGQRRATAIWSDRVRWRS